MQRVTRPTAASVMPAPPVSPGPPGFFTSGDPLAGILATRPGYEWYNGVQEELIAFLTAAGITPSETNLGQVLEACQYLFGGGGSDGANGWMWLPGRRIMQWGVVPRASRSLSASTVVTFPRAFPTACWGVFPAIDYSDAGLADMIPGRDTPSLTQVTLLAGINMTEGTETRVFGWNWFAIGK